MCKGIVLLVFLFTKAYVLGCMNPDMCIPYNYTGYSDNQCFNNCPINCGLDEIHCPAAVNPYTGVNLVYYIVQFYLCLYI